MSVVLKMNDIEILNNLIDQLKPCVGLTSCQINVDIDSTIDTLTRVIEIRDEYSRMLHLLNEIAADPVANAAVKMRTPLPVN